MRLARDYPLASAFSILAWLPYLLVSHNIMRASRRLLRLYIDIKLEPLYYITILVDREEMTMGEKKEFVIVNYFDVWGNARDGWEVNNLCQENRHIFLDMDEKGEALKLAIQNELKRINFFTARVRRTQWYIDWSCSDDSHLEIEQVKDGCPICRLEAAQDYEKEED